MKAIRFASFPAIILALTLIAGLMPASAQQPLAGQAPETGDTLFTRLGGFNAVAAVTDDFLERLASDPQLGRFFVGHGDDSMRRTRQLVVDFICNATGGPCFYTGRTMEVTHKGMGITAGDWEIAMGHLNGTLDTFQVPSPEREEVVAFIGGLRSGIVDAEIGRTTPPAQ